MLALKNLCDFLDNYLEINSVNDTCWNGLQYEGKHLINKVALSVDAGIETFKKAQENYADILIVHHGHFWKNRNPSIIGWAKERLKILIKNDISLYACHLPLDRHKTVGNNAQILKLLGAKITSEFLGEPGKNIGWIGELPEVSQLEEVSQKLTSKLHSKLRVVDSGNRFIKTVAVCSGGGGYTGFYEAMDKKVDLYITGDTIEIYHTAKDSGLNVIFGGHYNTETLGLKALSEIIKDTLNVETVFIDIPTEL